jgi:hypothetical protein
MVKKLLVTCTCIVLLISAAVPAAAQISYCKDFLEPGNSGGWGGSSLKTFEDTWTMPTGTAVEMDIWLNDVPTSLLTAGCFIEFDPALLTVASVVPNDVNNGGPWDSTDETKNFEVAPGQWFLALVNFACVEPDDDGDILLAKVTFDYSGPGDAEILIHTIPDFDTVVGCPSTNFDSQIDLNVVTINKGNGTSTTTTGSGTTTIPTSTTSPSTTTSSATSTTTTGPSSNSWKLAYAMMWGEDREQKLSLLRAFRNQLVARNEVVRHYVSLLYQHSSEVAGIFIKNPLLCLEISKLVEALFPSIESFFETEQLSLTAGQKDTVESFLNQFALEAPPALQGIIQNLRKDLKGGSLFAIVS